MLLDSKMKSTRKEGGVFLYVRPYIHAYIHTYLNIYISRTHWENIVDFLYYKKVIIKFR